MGWFNRGSKAAENDVDTDVENDASVADAPAVGPYDQADHPEQGDLLDAGALWIPKVPDMQLHAASDQSQKRILGIGYVKDNAAIQFEVFAAPRSANLWADVRRDLLVDIAKQGGSSTEVEGPYGVELRAQIPVPQSEQPLPHRFIGIDGPRWLLRISLYGIAAVDENRANELLEIAKDVVVVRGNAPHPPRERLELRVPQPEKPSEA